MAKTAAKPKFDIRARYVQAASADRFALAAQGANDGLWDWDLTQGRVLYSARLAEMLGLKPEEIGDKPEAWLARVHPEDAEGLRLAIAALVDGASQQLEHEQRVRHAGGAYRWMLTRAVASREPGGRTLRIAGSQTDVSDRHWQREQIAYDAFHDGLTALPNRELFLDRLGQALAVGRRRPGPGAAVLALDVDRFKLVNESLGHGAGDEFLTVLARRLESCLREGDTLARVGGDEFAILAPDADEEEMVGLARRVGGKIADMRFNFAGRDVQLTASLGIALYPKHAASSEEIIARADSAMYQAKLSGKNRWAIFGSAKLH